MYETFIILLTAHIMGDFVFQTSPMVQAKEESLIGLVRHSFIVAVITILIAGYFELSLNLLAYAGVFVAHFAVDGVKRWSGKNGAYAFLADQGAHLIALTIIAALAADIGQQSLWFNWLGEVWFSVLSFTSGLAACVFGGGVLISKATAPLMQQNQNNPIPGLENGGWYIGQLERALIFFFMLTGQTNAIGFLFAAKSILRFGEIKEPQKRQETEYIIIGTFMSFGWALFIAYLTMEALNL